MQSKIVTDCITRSKGNQIESPPEKLRFNRTHPLDGRVHRHGNVLSEPGPEAGAQPRLVVVPGVAEGHFVGARVHALVGDPDILKDIHVF